MSTPSEYTPPYDQENIFAKILRGEIPNHTIYEDEHTLGFLDVMPRNPGHSLIIPKSPAVNLTDVSSETLLHSIENVQKIAPSIVEAMAAEGFLFQQFNGAAAGQTVFHLHLHIIPCWEGRALKPHAKEMAPNDLLAEQADVIKKTLMKNGIS